MCSKKPVSYHAVALPAPALHKPQLYGDHSPFKGTAKELKAITVRNDVVKLVQRFGRSRQAVNPNRTICFDLSFPYGRDENIRISVSMADPHLMEVVEANRSFFPHFMNYGVDIWADRNVFNLEWDDHGTIDIVNFTRGPWEDLLTAIAAEWF